MKLTFSKEKTILVVVDVQGKLAHLMHENEFFFESVKRLIQGARILDLPVVWVEHNPKGLGSTIPEVAAHLSGLEPVLKTSFSCCGNGDFMKALDTFDRTQVLLAGMETHICIQLTALDMLDEGYEVQVVADATSSRSADNKMIALNRMRDAGAVVTNVETALYELMRVSEFKRFKEILNLIK